MKAVVQAILTYAMSCFKLPKRILSEINGMDGRFWWVKWEDLLVFIGFHGLICAHRKWREDLAFVILLLMMPSLQNKGGGFINDPDSLVSKVLKV